MKKRSLLFIVISLAAVLSFTGCATLSKVFSKEASALRAAKSALNKSNYPLAIKKSAMAITFNAEFFEAYDFIRETYPNGLQFYKSRIEQNKKGKNKFKWDQIYRDYDSLVSMTDAVQTLMLPLTHPVDGGVFDPEIKDYTSKRDRAKTTAIEAHYKEGVRLSKNRTWTTKRNCWNQFQTASKMAGSPYKNGKKIAATVYHREGIKRSKAATWQQKKEALDIFTQLSDIWDGEFNNHFSAAAKLNYRQANVMDSKKTRSGYREAITLYQEAIKWIPGYKDTEKRIKKAEMNAFTTFVVLELKKHRNRTVKADTAKLASAIKKNLTKPDDFKNFNEDTVRQQFNPEVYAEYPNIASSISPRYLIINNAYNACKKTGTNVVVFIELGIGHRHSPVYKTSKTKKEYSPEYLVNRFGDVIFDNNTHEPIVATPGVFDNQTLMTARANNQRVAIDGYSNGGSFTRTYKSVSKKSKFKKTLFSYRERSRNVKMTLKTKISIYDASRSAVLKVFNKKFTTEDIVTWRTDKRGNKKIFADKLNREYEPQSTKDNEELRQECYSKFEKESINWVAQNLSRFYP